MHVVRCFGDDYFDELGRGPDSGILYTNLTAPVVGIPDASAMRLAHTSAYGEAVVADGVVWSWGRNTFGEAIPTASKANVDPPAALAGITDAVETGTGGSFGCALRATGGVACWGSSYGGVTGLPDDAGDFISPMQIPGVSNAVKLGVGWDGFACALIKDGSVVCWGSNTSGELGRGADGGALPFATTAAPVQL
jgi:alpha-tubulin suppressor-like RCC1 family protein